ncbi:hypothetical protein F2P81_022308 [Scophthalmus maximus]|uniref:Uncharacterized protein n=1 Tax=Scophthalmus maximus TaxID=52904 RepID=A0A6A4RY22_SCOMX|nr:hypothetical protein F2P81_022308 [Scophthalmus maximus]
MRERECCPGLQRIIFGGETLQVDKYSANGVSRSAEVTYVGEGSRTIENIREIYFILHITAFVPCVRIDRAGTVTPSLRNLQRTKRQQSRRCTVHVQSSTVNAAAATPPITKDSRHCRCLFSVCRSPHLTSGYKAPPFMRLIV